MFTYDVVSESHQSPQKLATELTRRSRDGWEVVQITFDGKWFHAFVRHAGDVAVAPHPANEGSTSGTWSTGTIATEPAAVTADQSTMTTTATGTDAMAPANWYKDPSGRFELRYWNGSQWTEHVAKGGVQSVDPPRQ